MPRPIFDHAFDFSTAFDEFKRPLSSFASSFLVFSYSPNSKMRVVTYDKLWRALTTFELRTQVLGDEEEWPMLLDYHVPHFSDA